jgi:hypothetical protein
MSGAESSAQVADAHNHSTYCHQALSAPVEASHPITHRARLAEVLSGGADRTCSLNAELTAILEALRSFDAVLCGSQRRDAAEHRCVLVGCVNTAH